MAPSGELVRERIFIMPKGHRVARGVLQVGVVHRHLCEISVGTAAERVGQDEMKRDSRCRDHTFCFPNRSRETRDGKGSVTKVLENVKWRSAGL